MVEWLKIQLINQINAEAVLHGDFKLRNGARANYYIDMSRVSLTQYGAITLATAIVEELRGRGVEFDSIGGPVLGAAPLVTAVVMRIPYCRGFFVRKTPKDDTALSMVEGAVCQGDRVVLVEDVTTTGLSVLAAAEVMRTAYHCEVVRIISVVDRSEGAAEATIGESGYAFSSLLTIKDLNVHSLPPEPGC